MGILRFPQEGSHFLKMTLPQVGCESREKRHEVKMPDPKGVGPAVSQGPDHGWTGIFRGARGRSESQETTKRAPGKGSFQVGLPLAINPG